MIKSMISEWIFIYLFILKNYATGFGGSGMILLSMRYSVDIVQWVEIFNKKLDDLCCLSAYSFCQTLNIA